MKAVTRLLLLVITLFFTSNAFSQTFIGGKAGITFSDMSSGSFALQGLDDIIPHPKRLMGYQIGFTTEMPISNQLSFITGVNYVQKGFRVTEQFNLGGEEIPIPIGAILDAKVKYFEIPLTIQYAFGEQNSVRPYVKAGATVGYASSALLDAKVRVIIPINIAKIPVGLNSSLYNRFEVGAMIGGGVEFPMGPGKMMIEGQYTHGLTSLINTPIVNLKAQHNSFGLSVGYAIPLASNKFRGA